MYDSTFRVVYGASRNKYDHVLYALLAIQSSCPVSICNMRYGRSSYVTTLYIDGWIHSYTRMWRLSPCAVFHYHSTYLLYPPCTFSDAHACRYGWNVCDLLFAFRFTLGYICMEIGIRPAEDRREGKAKQRKESNTRQSPDFLDSVAHTVLYM